MKHNDAVQDVAIDRVCDRHRMMTLFSNEEQVSARSIMEPGEPSRSARNVATSVDNGRAATIEDVSSKPPKILPSL